MKALIFEALLPAGSIKLLWQEPAQQQVLTQKSPLFRRLLS
ncbi:hypothetical protein [Pontibacter chitinilyticus]